MEDTLFAQLLESLEEGADILEGRTQPARVTVIEEPDVLAFRKRHNLTREETAQVLCVSTRTIESWEQRRREPSGAAKMLLEVAQQFPEAVLTTARLRNQH